MDGRGFGNEDGARLNILRKIADFGRIRRSHTLMTEELGISEWKIMELWINGR